MKKKKISALKINKITVSHVTGGLDETFLSIGFRCSRKNTCLRVCGPSTTIYNM